MLEILENKDVLPVSSGKTISSYTSIIDGKEIILYNSSTSALYIVKMNLNDDKLTLNISKNDNNIDVVLKISSSTSKLTLFENISLVFFIKKNNLYIIAPDGYELYS